MCDFVTVISTQPRTSSQSALQEPKKLNEKDAVRTKALFAWREGAPSNRATWLEGLTHSPPLDTTHLTGTVSVHVGCVSYLSSGCKAQQTKWPTKDTFG